MSASVGLLQAMIRGSRRYLTRRAAAAAAGHDGAAAVPPPPPRPGLPHGPQESCILREPWDAPGVPRGSAGAVSASLLPHADDLTNEREMARVMNWVRWGIIMAPARAEGTQALTRVATLSPDPRARRCFTDPQCGPPGGRRRSRIRGAVSAPHRWVQRLRTQATPRHRPAALLLLGSGGCAAKQTPTSVSAGTGHASHWLSMLPPDKNESTADGVPTSADLIVSSQADGGEKAVAGALALPIGISNHLPREANTHQGA